MSPPTESSPLTGREAAKILGCSYQLILKLYHEGALSGFRTGRLIRFDRSEIEQYKQQQRNLPRAAEPHASPKAG
jgi:excisionase family DNA binding protein